MGQKEILKQENFRKSTRKDLKNYYDFIYKCDKCNNYYGDEEEDSPPYLCPICAEEKSSAEEKSNKK